MNNCDIVCILSIIHTILLQEHLTTCYNEDIAMYNIMLKKANRNDYYIIFSMWGNIKKQKSNIYTTGRKTVGKEKGKI